MNRANIMPSPPPPRSQDQASSAALGPVSLARAQMRDALSTAASARFLQGLNGEQRAAVESLDCPLLVLAGAGTGKTRVLTSRIANILAKGHATTQEILAVTFTNKAAREMAQRIESLTGNPNPMPWLGTFHAIGTRLLRRHAELVGLKPNFTILDTDDQLRLLKQILQAENIDDKRWPARSLAGLIDSWKNRGLAPDQVSRGEGASFANGEAANLYALYQARLKTLNAVDFGDLLLESLNLFRGHADILAQYQKRFRFILVDEYQDTNVVQYLWLRYLALPKHSDDRVPNLCCVGDDDQSIYGWRGAEVDNILRFEHDFAGAKIIRLERNYRSTGHILASASALIAHNEERLGKTLFTDGELGEKPIVTGVWDHEEEARVIGDEIELLQHRGQSLETMAVLVRAAFQMRAFEERFVTLGLPYRVIGGPRFYERMEVRDALAYLRIIAQGENDLAFERILNVPKRGLGDTTLATLHAYARRAQIPLLDAARFLCESDDLKPKPRSALRALLNDIFRWRALVEPVRDAPNAPLLALDTAPPDPRAHITLAETVLEESGMIEMWRKDRTPEAEGRLENLKELVRSMEEFPDLAAFLEHISLVMDTETHDGNDKISIMTLHAAKGLEFDTVFLPGWEEAVFPSPRSLDENGRAGLEEERRLAYVGMTRAKQKLNLYFATNRRIHGQWTATMPSRFLDELPADHVIVNLANAMGQEASLSRFDQAFARQERGSASSYNTSSYNTPGWQRAQSYHATQRAPHKNTRLIEGEILMRSEARSSFTRDMRVFHQKFGPGTVQNVDGNKVSVAFDKAGTKMVLDSFLEARS